MDDKILTEITNFCNECGSKEDCPETDCVLYRIENIVTNDETYKSKLDYITNLQQENKHLDKVNCQLRKNINNNVYKSRIEKAVEYIENTPLYEITYDYNMEEELEIQNVSDETASNKLLDILNGRSDE